MVESWKIIQAPTRSVGSEFERDHEYVPTCTRSPFPNFQCDSLRSVKTFSSALVGEPTRSLPAQYPGTLQKYTRIKSRNESHSRSPRLFQASSSEYVYLVFKVTGLDLTGYSELLLR